MVLARVTCYVTTGLGWHAMAQHAGKPSLFDGSRTRGSCMRQDVTTRRQGKLQHAADSGHAARRALACMLRMGGRGVSFPAFYVARVLSAGQQQPNGCVCVAETGSTRLRAFPDKKNEKLHTSTCLQHHRSVLLHSCGSVCVCHATLPVRYSYVMAITVSRFV